MPTYYDSQNNAHVLTERLGSGGEGTVYLCEDFRFVGKIYHEPITEEKAEKLRWMAANKNERLLKVAAWVVDVLTNAPDGKVVGFLMPNVKAKEIHELYSLKSRRVHFPDATWHFLVHTAANVARAFYNLHRANHIMGDVNHGNCVVLADGTVKLIDCDSYSIKIGETRYPCEVGVGTHLAPELQGADLSDVEREKKHDNFGLAVIIFQLLFLGRHPFAGNYLGAEDKSIEECIRELRFAYGEGARHRMVKQPPGTLPLAAVSTRVALMFERAFLTEDRPEPREWIEALEDLSNNLEQCRLHPGHLFYAELAACPWCKIEGETGLMLFPFITAGAHLDNEKPFNIFTVENLIANLGITQTLPAKPPPMTVWLPPSREIVETKRENQKQMLISFGIHFAAIVFLMAIFGIGTAIFFGVLMMVFWLMYTNNSVKYLRESLEENLADAQAQWETFENDWERNRVPRKLSDDLQKIRSKIGDYQKFQQDNAREMNSLRKSVVRRQLQEHLGSIPLADANIIGITDEQRVNLLEKDITTAADIREKKIRLFHNFAGEVVPKLLEWRGQTEKTFVANEQEIKAEELKFINGKAETRRRIEKDIEYLLGSLRSGAVNLRRHQQKLSSDAAELATRLAQTQSDFNFLGTNAITTIGLVLITFLTPYFGYIISQTNAPRSTRPTYSSGITTAPPSKPPISYPNTDLEVPDENITDEEIAALSPAKINLYALNLYKQSTVLAYADKPDLDEAEKKIRLAMRLKSPDVSTLNHLAYILYEKKEYEEAIKYLNKSLAIEKDNYGTRLYIAVNYLELKRFKEARRLLIEITKENDQSFEGFYNLGLAYIGLKDYKSAAKSLETAVDFGRDDADAHYHLGICYYKSGDTDKLYDEYETLSRLNEDLAEKLRKETKIAKIVQSIATR